MQLVENIWSALIVQVILMFIALFTLLLFMRRSTEHKYNEMLQFHYQRLMQLAIAYLLTNIIAVFSLAFIYIKAIQ